MCVEGRVYRERDKASNSPGETLPPLNESSSQTTAAARSDRHATGQGFAKGTKTVYILSYRE